MTHNILGAGTHYHPEYWGSSAQADLLAEVATALQQAPLFVPRMPRTNQPWSIRMSNMGSLGWVSDKKGYRYQAEHPETGAAWPQIPSSLLGLWDAVSGCAAPPECCLINYYDKPTSKMGLHQDRDELAFEAPVVSVSLGDSAVFRMGGPQRRGSTRSIKLHSGDVFVFGGEARLHFHGLDRILHGSSQLLANHTAFGNAPGNALGDTLGDTLGNGGRINLTLRRVHPI